MEEFNHFCRNELNDFLRAPPNDCCSFDQQLDIPPINGGFEFVGSLL